jgi:hypothetical protein
MQNLSDLNDPRHRCMLSRTTSVTSGDRWEKGVTYFVGTYLVYYTEGNYGIANHLGYLL